MTPPACPLALATSRKMAPTTKDVIQAVIRIGKLRQIEKDENLWSGLLYSAWRLIAVLMQRLKDDGGRPQMRFL